MAGLDSELRSRSGLRFLLDFGRMGMEEKPANGCPVPERQTGKRTVQKDPSFWSPDVPSSHQSTPGSRFVWRKGVTLPHGASRANTTGNRGEQYGTGCGD